MKSFPNSRTEIMKLATDLVAFLRAEMEDKQGRPEWTRQNYDLLDRFFRSEYCDECRFAGSANGGEFLWDFAGHRGYNGMLITAESEHDTDPAAIAEDFDRLLYGISPLKLMICRIEKRFSTVPLAQEEAERIRIRVHENLQQNSVQYCSGAVFVVYCTWWAAEGKNRDFAYFLQIDGEPNCASVRRDQQFELFPG